MDAQVGNMQPGRPDRVEMERARQAIRVELRKVADYLDATDKVPSATIVAFTPDGRLIALFTSIPPNMGLTSVHGNVLQDHAASARQQFNNLMAAETQRAEQEARDAQIRAEERERIAYIQAKQAKPSKATEELIKRAEQRAVDETVKPPQPAEESP